MSKFTVQNFPEGRFESIEFGRKENHVKLIFTTPGGKKLGPFTIKQLSAMLKAKTRRRPASSKR